MFVVWCLQFLLITVSALHIEDVIKERNKMFQGELDAMVGSDIILTDNELQANNVIMQLKNNLLNESFYHPETFNVSGHFFEYKNSVKNTQLYKIIQQMPKGAVLHAHGTALLNPDFLVSLTYAENLHICFEDNNNIKFKFAKRKPTTDCNSQWQDMWDARYSSENIEAFDAELRKHFTIAADNPSEAYSDVNAAWNKFSGYFTTSSGLLTYKPVWEKYFYEALRAFRDDNIMYIELRCILPELYDLDGNTFDSVATAHTYYNVLEVFKKEHPDFFGAKLIYAPSRLADDRTVKDFIAIAQKLKEQLPKFFAGFDLVGQEDLGRPLKEFLPILAKASDTIDYFFHAGETKYYGCDTDENLIDAVALGTKRIGHGYALLKHPLVLDYIKKNQIAVEVNVISNNVLNLVSDIRNHPLAAFLAFGVPVVISSDDPGAWEADPMSLDFFVTFVGVASQHADLRLLKKLALNSLYYSTAENKDKMIFDFEKRWSKFIKSIISKSEVPQKKSAKVKVQVFDHVK